ncbi:hypothetical protein VB780_25950 [Leptolyngbya sp. CCNP1308]|uniref:hypothetical protein n=1 Tax=Leptolyngbya sp. CCNP1308 TaxID=3110255 RepID=UPI002B1F9352|nr:hypothetical protein [Leptolyngbya sp. CCNP1308]MEA5452044.1 hypothetical protein [Leptolyngbya sp. CCNP1308]
MVWLYIRNYWTNVLSIFSALGLGSVSVLESWDQGTWVWGSPYGIIFIVSALGSLFGQGVQLLDSPGKRSLQLEFERAVSSLAERRESDLVILKNELMLLSEMLEFGSEERISLYAHQNQKFVMISRYSKNPEYDKRGRGIQNEDQGIIGKAWRDGQAFVYDLPECNGNDDFEYLRVMEINWGIDRSIARKFSMKSRTFGAYSIENTQGIRSFVLVFESMDPVGFLQEDLDNLMQDSKERRRISLLLDHLKNVTPELDIPLNEGM